MAALSVRAADLTVTGNLTVTGTTNSAGAIDSDSNTFTFGTQGGSFGGSLLYQDNNVDTLTFGINRSIASWLWQHNSGVKAMRLDSAHQLLLFNAAGTTAGVTLSPASNQISLGTATLTGSGANITVGGTLTAQSSIINNGTIIGGSTGLSLSAGGTNQNITLTPTGTGYTRFNGKVGIGVSPIYYNFEVLGVPKFYPAAGGNDYVLLGAAGQSTGGSGVVLGYNQTYNGTAMPNSAYLQAESQGVAYRNLLLAPLGGNIGIGTTSPNYRLEVNGAARNSAFGVKGAQPGLQLENTASGGHTWNLWAVGPSETVQNGGLALFDATAGAYRLALDSVGNVGIGTTNPTRLLSINGSANAYFGFKVADTLQATIGSDANGDFFVFDDQSSSYRLVVNTAGNVGIGTISPGQKLTVWGANGAPATSGNSADGVARFGASVTNLVLDVGVIGGGTPYTWLQSRAQNAYDSNYALALNPNGGNVGIGTLNPTQKLSVAGTVRAYAVIVDTGWSDYVFDENYRLAPLSEVEQHIKAEKHLPGIPSAAEVAEHGVSLGDMQSKLLAKVEELTLHLIAQEKEIAALKNQNANFQKQLGEFEAARSNP